MTLVDSLDSILMLYSYAGFPERSFALFEHGISDDKKPILPISPVTDVTPLPPSPDPSITKSVQEVHRDPVLPDDLGINKHVTTGVRDVPEERTAVTVGVVDERMKKELRVKKNAMSGLSVILTLMSILVAFRYVALNTKLRLGPFNSQCDWFSSISLITVMGLIGDNCARCQEAAEAEDGGGWAGKWWRGWANVSYSMCSKLEFELTIT